ncbi:MAG: cbb3-type cytochrome oxidase assembly protein CcoS [Actinobacteria bacterium]|nr:MAG: cbb3-type cytochrome oxidase assembly protein CcoS [Actinomycetota bacterium]
MDLAVYMVAATFVVFSVGALVALAWSFASGQWRDLDSAKYLVLAEDDPEPVRPARRTRAHVNGA